MPTKTNPWAPPQETEKPPIHLPDQSQDADTDATKAKNIALARRVYAALEGHDLETVFAVLALTIEFCLVRGIDNIEDRHQIVDNLAAALHKRIDET